MRIYREKDYDAMSRRAAHVMAAEIIHRPDCVLGLATGSTPIGMYKQLIEWNKAGDITFKEVRTVNLDEYKGLSPEHDQGYRYFMQKQLFDHVDILPENTRVPDGLAADADAECAAYDAYIRSLGGIDLQLLGVGHNGHIGFNEPADIFVTPTHVVDLTERTIARPSPWASAPSWPPRRSSLSPAARRRPRRCITPSAERWTPTARAPFSSSTPTW